MCFSILVSPRDIILQCPYNSDPMAIATPRNTKFSVETRKHCRVIYERYETDIYSQLPTQMIAVNAIAFRLRDWCSSSETMELVSGLVGSTIQFS